MRSSTVAELLNQVRAAGNLDFDDAIRLLELDPDSVDTFRLRQAAHQASLSWSDSRGYVWFAIGLDSLPCPRNCVFCAFGEKWRVVEEPWTIDEREALDIIRAHDVPGVRFITLRSTDSYPVEALCRLAAKAQPLNHAKLVANVGDMSRQTAAALRQAGFHMIYHALRLREGIDTCIDPEARLRTMRAARDAGLELAALVDPIGTEHSSNEIAQRIFQHKSAGAAVSGAMARVPVPGTPKGDAPAISVARLAQITAVARLACGPETSFICAHPADEALVFSGANTVVVERGGNPRDKERLGSDWRTFSVADAFALLEKAGYRIGENRGG